MAGMELNNVSTSVLVLLVIFMALSIVAVALRLISRRIARTKLWWDDYFVIASLVRSILAQRLRNCTDCTSLYSYPDFGLT